MEDDAKLAYAEHLLREALIYAMDEAGIHPMQLVGYSAKIAARMRKQREDKMLKELQNG